MNQNQETKSSYSLLPVEEKLLEGSMDQKERVSYLPPVHNLTVVILRKRLFVKSAPNKHQFIRMFLFGVLMKAYTDKDKVSLLERIKRIIYGGSQFEQCSLKDSQLVKKINSVPFDHGVQTQNAVLELFLEPNDAEIINAFAEIMTREEVGFEKMPDCKDWFQEQFGEKIKVSSKYNPTENQIFFLENEGGLLYESQRDVEDLEGGSLSANMLTTSELLLTNQSKLNAQKENDFMELSLFKPSAHMVSQSTPSPNFRSKRSNDSSPNPSPFEYEKKKQKSQGFNIWDYLCC